MTYSQHYLYRYYFFSLSLILILLTILFLLLLLLLLILYSSLQLSESVLDSIYICDNSIYISIWYWTIFGNYKKFFIKYFNILKIFHLKFREKIAFRKSMFQSIITIFPKTIRTAIFNHIDSFGNTSIEFISIYGMKYSSETNAILRILKVEL